MIEAAYMGTLDEFLKADPKDILRDMKEGFRKVFGEFPNQGEINAWEDLILNLRLIFDREKFLLEEMKNLRLLLEVRMPYSSTRADLLFVGKKNKKITGLIIEHKQWTDKNVKRLGNNILINGEEVLNPCEQAEMYATYLRDFMEVFHDSDIKYLAFLPYFENVSLLVRNNSDVIIGKQNKNLVEKILEVFDTGISDSEFMEFRNSSFKPSKTLMNQARFILSDNDAWILLDEQRIVFNKIQEILSSNVLKKTVIVVKGKPGTGKTVVALHLLSWLLSKGKSVRYMTNSKGITETLRFLIKNKLKYSKQIFIYSSTAIRNFLQKGETLDIVIFDEAQRLKQRTCHPSFSDEEHQAKRIIDLAKVSIFFLDEDQRVRPGEVGRIEDIRKLAQEMGAQFYEYELKVQFRNGGNENFISWLDYMLGLESIFVNPESWIKDLEFKIFDDVVDLENALADKEKEGNTVRLVAGFCWPWNKPKGRNLPLDVRIGDWKKPWNRKDKSGSTYYKWPTKSKGQLEEIGCVYTAQGFEFDYVGVIWGKDLIYRKNKGWIAQPEESYDPAIKNKNSREVLDYLKNTYRVLLTRGIKGCFVYFQDEETKQFFLEKLKNEVV